MILVCASGAAYDLLFKLRLEIGVFLSFYFSLIVKPRNARLLVKKRTRN